MDMNQLFMALPSDLQYEVLAEFVGTHVVRKGKLLRKLVNPFHHGVLKHNIIHNDRNFPWRYGKYGKIIDIWL